MHRKRMSIENYVDTLVREEKTEDIRLKRKTEDLYLEIQERVNLLESLITKRAAIKASLVYLATVPSNSYPGVFDCNDLPIFIGASVEIKNSYQTYFPKPKKRKEGTKEFLAINREFRFGIVSKIVRVTRNSKCLTRVYFVTLFGTETYRSPSNLKVHNE